MEVRALFFTSSLPESEECFITISPTVVPPPPLPTLLPPLSPASLTLTTKTREKNLFRRFFRYPNHQRVNVPVYDNDVTSMTRMRDKGETRKQNALPVLYCVPQRASAPADFEHGTDHPRHMFPPSTREGLKEETRVRRKECSILSSLSPYERGDVLSLKLSHRSSTKRAKAEQISNGPPSVNYHNICSRRDTSVDKLL